MAAISWAAVVSGFFSVCVHMPRLFSILYLKAMEQSIQSGFAINGDYVENCLPCSGPTVEVQKEKPDKLVQDIKLRWKGILGLDGDL